ELVADPATMAEVDFVDAVSANLRRGRVVVLVVGDGIRAETETLAAALRSHAGLHFTFALVELGVYGLPEGNGLIVVPRTLACTVMIERGIVRIAEGRVQIEAPPAVAGTTARARGSITAEQFFEAMAARDPNLPDRL